MSRMTYLQPVETSVDMITSFGGYNHNISISDGEFYDMENLSSDKFPLVSIRGKRTKLTDEYKDSVSAQSTSHLKTTYSTAPFLFAENQGIYLFIFSTNLLVYKYNETLNLWIKDTTQTITASAAPASYVNMGAFIVLPDIAVAYNTVKQKAIYLNYECTCSSAIIYIVKDGDYYDLAKAKYLQGMEPSSPSNNDIWLDNSSEPVIVKRYSSATGMWSKVELSLRILTEHGEMNAWKKENEWATDNAGRQCFLPDDAIEIDFDYDENHKLSDYIYRKDGQKNWIIEYASGHGGTPSSTPSETGATRINWIDIPIEISRNLAIQIYAHFSMVPPPQSAVWSEGSIKFKLRRRMPLYDYMTEANNRLWACRNGVDHYGDPINEIFACKLGDPTNWNYFGNTAIDSYYMSLGTGGKFTGATTYQSNPVFFKEDSVHRIYGNYPSNYQLKTVMGYGVKDGSSKSITELNDTVYYLSNNGMMAYRGGTPVEMTRAFGMDKYTDGIASSAGNKIFISLKDKDNVRQLFAFDDRFQTWYKETRLPATQVFTYNSKLFVIADKDVYCLSEFNGLTSYEGEIPWFFDTGKIGFATPYRKFINKVTLRLRLGLRTKASLYIQYDSDGNWNHVTDIRPTGEVTTVAIPVTPHRCDHFNLRLQGEGELEVINLTKFYEESNDYD